MKKRISTKNSKNLPPRKLILPVEMKEKMEKKPQKSRITAPMFKFTSTFYWKHKRDSDATTALVEKLIEVIEHHGGQPPITSVIIEVS